MARTTVLPGRATGDAMLLAPIAAPPCTAVTADGTARLDAGGSLGEPVDAAGSFGGLVSTCTSPGVPGVLLWTALAVSCGEDPVAWSSESRGVGSARAGSPVSLFVGVWQGIGDTQPVGQCVHDRRGTVSARQTGQGVRP